MVEQKLLQGECRGHQCRCHQCHQCHLIAAAVSVAVAAVTAAATATLSSAASYLFIGETTCQFSEYCLSETAITSEIYS
jgi:hypothetical protein